MTRTTRLPDCCGQPALLTILPLLYVAWADGDLGEDELELIDRRLKRLSFLDADCEAVARDWLDPGRPPSPRELHALLAAIHDRAARLPTPHRLSLVDLGLALAQVDGQGVGPNDSEIAALTDLVRELGLEGAEATRWALHLVPRTPPEPVADAVAAPPLPELAERLQQPFPATRARILELLTEPASAPPVDVDRATYRAWVRERTRELGRRGFGALAFPPEVGGSDSPGAFVAAFETLAFGDLSVVVKFGVQYGLFAGAIHQLGSDRHRLEYLEDAATMRRPGCFAMTETGHGSNVQGLRTTATYDPDSDEFVIHTPDEAARKDYIGNAACDARSAVVFARLLAGGADYGVHAFIVDIRDADGGTLPGVRIEDCGAKLGLDGVDNGRIWFDRVRIPRRHALDRFGGIGDDGTYDSPIPSDNKRFFTTLGALVGGRVSVALAALSVAKVGLTIAVGYGNRRRQFSGGEGTETLLLDYPSHQLRLMPLLARTVGLHFALRHLAGDYVDIDEQDRRRLETDAAGLKAWASRHATDALQECREACGGQGYLAINRFADLIADSDAFTTFEGDNTVLLQLVAKAMLTRYRKQFADLTAVGIARFLIARAGERLADVNPVAARRTDSEHLRDPEFHADALRHRQQHLLATAARRLKHRIDDGMPAGDAFLACQNHLIAAARARTERQILTRMHAAVEATSDADSLAVLSAVSALLGLDLLVVDRAWFQEHGLLGSAKAKAVQREHEGLCAELRPHAQSLVDAFGIPDELLPEIATA